MFEEQIAQGHDMIRRLEAESRLTQSERDALPSHRRVPRKEAEAWRKTIEEKMRSSFGPDTFARYQVAWDLCSEEIREGVDAYSCALNVRNRIVAFLEELDSRAPKHSSAQVTKPSAEARRPSKRDESRQTYDVFISHASEDKDAIARPLAAALVERGLTVWFDEATLELGDSLRRNIDNGLAYCRYGIVILSPHFLEKEWPQRELDGLVARETASGEKALLPIWHELDRPTLMKYSPLLRRQACRAVNGGSRGAGRENFAGPEEIGC
jgi:TIR domain